MFDFARQAPGTQPINLSAEYSKVVIFFDFGLENATVPTTYYWEDVAFGGEAPPPIALPITFDADIDYQLTPFEGAESRLVQDPEDDTNTVAEFVRTAGAGVPAGVTVADQSGFAEPIPFAEGATTLSVRVWTPAAGTPVRLKVEKVGDPTVSVETEAASTQAMTWETLVFDFADEAPGTAALNFASEYTKASIFFDFGLEGAANPTTYYWEDLAFGSGATSAEGGTDLPDGLRLSQSFPNPVQETTTIRFTTPGTERVTLHVYNVLGQQVATLVDATLAAGEHEATLDASQLASGTYLYRLNYGSASVARSMIVTR